MSDSCRWCLRAPLGVAAPHGRPREPPTSGALSVGIGLQILLVFVLVLVNAALLGSELALLSLRDSQLTRLQQRGRRGRVLAKLAHDPNRFLATIQIGITLAGFLASATAAVSLAEPLERRLGFLGKLAGPVSIVAGHPAAQLRDPGARRAGAQAHRVAAGRALVPGGGPSAVGVVGAHPTGGVAAGALHRRRGAAVRHRPQRGARRTSPRRSSATSSSRTSRSPRSSARSSRARSRSPTAPSRRSRRRAARCSPSSRRCRRATPCWC